MRKSFFVFGAFWALFALGNDGLPDIQTSGTATEIRKPITLKPGESARVITRKVTTIKTTLPLDGTSSTTTTTTTTSNSNPNANSNSSWRCNGIPDDAFTVLGGYNPKSKSARADWENRAAEFISTYAANCPSYAALERELPPELDQKRYTTMLAILFDLNRMVRPEGLLRIAREDEIIEHQAILSGRRGDRIRNNQKLLEAYNEEHQHMVRKVAAARMLLDIKFPEEVKARYEAQRFVQKFGTDFLNKNGGVKTENFPALKNLLKTLTPQQRLGIKNYLKDVLAQREYPKAGLLPTREEELARAKQPQRGPASIPKKEAGNRAVIQLLLFEME